MASIILAEAFRPEDYLLSRGHSSPGSPSSAAASPPEAAKQWGRSPEPLPAKAQLRLALPRSRADEQQHPHIDFVRTSTVSIEAEAPSPTRRRRRPFVGGHGPSDSGSDGEGCSQPGSARGCGQDNAALQGRYGCLQPSPSASACSSLPAGPAGGDGFATPPAGQLSASSRGDAGAHTRTPGTQSVAGTPSSSTGRPSTSPQQQRLEVLEARLAAEAEARRELQRRLVEQRSEADEQLEEVGRRYEEQLACLRRELQQRAAQATTPGGEQLSSGRLSGSPGEALSEEEQEALRRQLAEQELLLKAYQAENELAVARMRQQEAERRRQAAEAATQLEEMQTELARLQAERARQPPATPGGGDAARLHEVLRLQGEMQAVRAAAEQRERELQQRVRQLEQRLAEAQHGLDEYASQSAQQAAQLAQAQQQLASAQQQLAESDALVQQQAAVVVQLERQLLVQDAQAGSAGSGFDGSDRGAQRMQQLETENAALRQALQHAQEQGLQLRAQLQAQGRAGGQALHVSSSQQQLAAEVQAKLERLQSAFALKEEQHQRQLKALRHEHEKLRVEQGIRAASKAGAARVRELEAQLVVEREASARKLRILESRLKDAEARSARAASGGRPATSKAGTPASTSLAPAQPAKHETLARRRPMPAAAAGLQDALQAANSQLQQREQRVRRLEGELARRDAELASLLRRAEVADERANEAAEREAAAQGEIADLRQAVAEVTAANDGLQATVRQVAVLERQMAELRQQGQRLQEAEAALAALRQAQAESEATLAAERQRAQQERAAAAEQAEWPAREVADCRAQQQAAEAAAAELRVHIGRLEGDLRSARAGLPWLPSAADFSALERRMLEVESAAQRREAQWRAVAEDSARAAVAEQRRLRQQFEGAMAAKEEQVEEFRRQLEGLLSAARVLHLRAG